MKTLIIGNRFDNSVNDSFLNVSEIDIFDIFDTLSIDIVNPKGYDLIISEHPIYPTIKEKGTVLICFGNDNVGESSSKVYKIKANAVILNKDEIYDLVDALGNLWCRTSDLVELLNNIFKLYEWTKSSIRKESLKSDSFIPYDVVNIPELVKFCDIIRNVSNKVENERGGRYFGNASTRCSKMFPSIRNKYNDNEKWKHFQYILVSKRNISKEKIQPNDFVITQFGKSSESVGKILYYGDNKPSVDTPGQIYLYQDYPNINFMIHGHAYINTEFLIPYTNKYCSCGDVREVNQIEKYVQHKDCDFFIINLINHGFIIGTDTLERMEKIVNDSNFIYRNIGEEKVKI